MQTDFYSESMPYEYFVRNAYLLDFDKARNNGGHQSHMRNLMWTERGDSYAKHLGSYDKQLVPVKKYMNKALDLYMKWKLTAEEKEEFKALKEALESAYSTDDLTKIVNKGIELTQRFKDH